ncbi:MAG: DedA family protein [Candidatus Pacearchaeota archaeon]
MVIPQIIDFIFHIDKYLSLILENFGAFSYVILFLIIFLETGFVITPFLPGDSLLFVTGALAAIGKLSIALLFFILAAAAIFGDTANYWIGSFFGEKVFSKSALFRKDYLEKTKSFFKKHGGKTIIFARFIPIIRTFAPFVAGVGKMNYLRFLSFNVIGGLLWVALFVFAGYFFGTIPFVKNNLSWFIIGIILLSISPAIYRYLMNRAKKDKQKIKTIR